MDLYRYFVNKLGKVKIWESNPDEILDMVSDEKELFFTEGQLSHLKSLLTFDYEKESRNQKASKIEFIKNQYKRSKNYTLKIILKINRLMEIQK